MNFDKIDYKEQLQKIGVDLKSKYPKLILDGKNEEEYTNYEQLIIASIEDNALNTSKALEEIYLSGSAPRMNDTLDLAKNFINRIFSKFHKAICAELLEKKDLSSKTKDIILTMIPTVIALLNLPASMTVVAIPISVIVTKVGLKTMCDNVNIKIEDETFLFDRLDIHKKNLLFYEKEMTENSLDLFSQTELKNAIEKEERLILNLKEKLKLK